MGLPLTTGHLFLILIKAPYWLWVKQPGGWNAVGPWVPLRLFKRAEVSGEPALDKSIYNWHHSNFMAIIAFYSPNHPLRYVTCALFFFGGSRGLDFQWCADVTELLSSQPREDSSLILSHTLPSALEVSRADCQSCHPLTPCFFIVSEPEANHEFRAFPCGPGCGRRPPELPHTGWG